MLGAAATDEGKRAIAIGLSVASHLPSDIALALGVEIETVQGWLDSEQEITDADYVWNPCVYCGGEVYEDATHAQAVYGWVLQNPGQPERIASPQFLRVFAHPRCLKAHGSAEDLVALGSN